MNKKQNSKQKIQKLAENDARPERAIQPTELLNDTLRRICLLYTSPSPRD